MDIPITPRITVDPLAFIYRDSKLQLLLAKRVSNPEKDAWSIPGGHVAPGQTLLAAIEASLTAKTGVDIQTLRYVEQLHAFDTTGLDPRGHAITIAFLCLGDDKVKANSDLSGKPQFIDMASMPKLAFDHISIVNKGLDELKELLQKTTAALYILPQYFTMSDLHNLYEVVLGKKLDRRNFRKKMLSLQILKDSGKTQQSVANRPGILYCFRSQKLYDLTKPVYF